MLSVKSKIKHKSLVTATLKCDSLLDCTILSSCTDPVNQNLQVNKLTDGSHIHNLRTTVLFLLPLTPPKHARHENLPDSFAAFLYEDMLSPCPDEVGKMLLEVLSLVPRESGRRSEWHPGASTQLLFTWSNTQRKGISVRQLEFPQV